MTLPAPRERYTRQQYLELEAAAEVKHEFHAGEILAMSGGSYEHSRITANLIREAGLRLKGTPCFVLESNMRVRLAVDDRYVYPDATIVCGQPQFDPEDKNRTTILNPKVVIEVLSGGTEAYDRGTKFTAYRDLKSLEEYVLVSQDRPLVETFVRQAEGFWLFSAAHGQQAVVPLRSVGIEVPLSEIYAGLTFAAQPGTGESHP